MVEGQAQEVSSDMEGTEQFESMNEEQIDQVLDEHEAATEQQQETVDDSPTPEEQQAQPEATLTDLQTKMTAMDVLLQRMSKENGQQRKWQADFDKLREDMERRAQPQTSQQEQAAVDYLNGLFEKFVEDKYGKIISRAEDDWSTQDYFREVQRAAGSDYSKLDPYIAHLWREKSVAAYERGDPDAEAWVEKAEKEPSFVVLEASRLAAAAGSQQGQEARDQRAASGQRASRTLRSGQRPLPAGQPTQADFDRMTEKEIDEWMDKNPPPK